MLFRVLGKSPDRHFPGVAIRNRHISMIRNYESGLLPAGRCAFQIGSLTATPPRVILELLGSPNVSPHNLYSLVARNVHHSENRSAPLGGARRRPARLRHPARLGRRGRRNKAEDEGRLQNPRSPPPAAARALPEWKPAAESSKPPRPGLSGPPGLLQARIPQRRQGRRSARCASKALRSICACNEPDLRGNPKKFQRLMGHSRVQTTLDIYAKFLRDEEPPEGTL